MTRHCFLKSILVCALVPCWAVAKAQENPETPPGQSANQLQPTTQKHNKIAEQKEKKSTEGPFHKPQELSDQAGKTDPKSKDLNAQQLPEMVVKEKRPQAQKEYMVEESSTGTKTPLPTLEIPHTVNVITRQLLEDQGANSAEDIWRNVAGAHTSFGEGGGGSMVMRGFSVTAGSGGGGFSYPLFFNGLRGQPFGGYNSPRLYNVERVEVLKGPAAVLYGSGGPGGIINMVSRKPKPEYSHEIELAAGSYDLYRGHIHSTGPLTTEKELLYLMDIGYENAGSFRDHVKTRNLQLTSSFAWLLSENTRLDLEFGIIDDDRKGQPDRGIPCIDGEFFVLPNSFNPQEKSDLTEVAAHYGELHFQNKFIDSLSLNLRLRAFESEREYHMHFPGMVTDGMQSRTYMEGRYRAKGIAGDANLLWKLEFELMTNALLAGFETTYDRNKSRSRRATEGVPDLDVYDPVYDADPASYTYLPLTKSSTKTLRYGVYLQDHLKLWKRLHLSAGARYDAYSNITSDYKDDGGAATFKGGVLYDLLEIQLVDLALYGSLAQSYEPQSARGSDQGPFDPLEGLQLEAGVKSSWLNNKLTATVAGFFIDQKNVLVSDPDDPTLMIMIGEQASKGFEVEVTGHVTGDCSVSANYAYTDAEIVKHSDKEQEGKSLSNVAKNQAGLWARYDFRAIGLVLFGGLVYVDKRSPYSKFIERYGVKWYPAYTRVDAGLSYSYQNLTARLNINNLFDEDIALGGRGGYGYMPGEPRTFALSLRAYFWST